MKNAPKRQVGLLLCDDVDQAARARHGTYAEMFRAGLGAVDEQLALQSVRCYEGEMPDSPDDFDAFLISGSRKSVYEPLPWIAQLQDFIRKCRDHRKKTVGICFGHQLIAHALGGETRKADVGWGIGVHRARVTESRAWMADGGNGGNVESREPDEFNLVAVHQDQVVALPPGFRAIAGSDFCPIGMFADDDVMLGIQGHPEFSREFCESLIRKRREILGEHVFRQSLDSLTRLQPDSRRVFGWIARFMRA